MENGMDRRSFNLSLLKASAAAFLPGFIPHTSYDEHSLPSELYAKAMVIDSLCAPLGDLDAPPSAQALAAVHQSGVTAMNFTISALDFEGTIQNLASVQKLVDDHPDIFLIVRQPSDLSRCKRENKTGLMLGFQQTAFLEQDPERIGVFRKLGIRIMQLTYNNHSAFGDGCLDRTNA